MKIYEYSESHPADEARMRIILLMLDKLGLKEDKERIQASWDLFLKETEPFKPNEYALLYPQKLLQQMVDEFFEFYQNADLASYPELMKSGKTSVAQLLNEAWSNAQTDPAGYFTYETGKIDNLKNEFGIK